MNIDLKKTPEQIELLKAAASKNREVSARALEILAAFIAPVMQEVINRAAVILPLYKRVGYKEDSYPSIPLDLYTNKKANYVRTWSAGGPGGLPSSHVQGLDELKFVPWKLESAVSMSKKFARLGQLENLARAIERMTQEILSKVELDSATPILAGVAQASTDVNGQPLSHVVAANTAGIFQVDDLNKLILRADKINSAWDGGTPAAQRYRGVTDIYGSPELFAQIRSFAYNPMNTRVGAVVGTPSVTAAAADSVALPDSVRESIYRAAGTAEIFDVNIHKLYELSPESIYSVVFDNYYGGSFTVGTNNLVLGIDATRPSLIRPVKEDEAGNEVIVEDDQYVKRQAELGFYTEVEHATILADDRALTALVW